MKILKGFPVDLNGVGEADRFTSQPLYVGL